MPNARVKTHHYERDIAVIGIGRSPFGKKRGRTWMSLAIEAYAEALQDAQLSGDEIDGLCVHGGSSGLPGLSSDGVRNIAHTLGIHPSWHIGAKESPGEIGSVIPALTSISAGLCRHVLCLDVRQAGSLSDVWLRDASAAAEDYLRTWGQDRRALGLVAVAAQHHALLNPNAGDLTPIDMHGYLGRRNVFGPFSELDLATPQDGATALVLSPAEFASRARTVRFDSIGTRQTVITGDNALGLEYSTCARATAEHMWRRSSLTPRDVSLALLDDRCTFDVLLGAEALHLCPPGGATELVSQAVRIGPLAGVPLNPDGGQLGRGHAGGYGQLYEAVLQLRGAAGARQVPNARVAAVLSRDPSGSCIALTMRAEPF